MKCGTRLVTALRVRSTELFIKKSARSFLCFIQDFFFKFLAKPQPTGSLLQSMDWKTLILIAVVHNVLSLPLEFCCSDNNESNLIKYPSSGPILDAESPSSELYFFGHRPLIMNPNVPLKDDDNCNEPSCDNKKNLKFSSRSLREKPIVAVGPQLHRTKR